VVPSLFIAVSGVLAFMGFRYKREYPQARRHYLPVSSDKLHLKEPLVAYNYLEGA
jgi:energy-converting hydrogenase Eha subunit F